MKQNEKLELVRDNTLWRLKAEMVECTKWGTDYTTVDTPVGLVLIREEDYDEDGNYLAYTWCIEPWEATPERLKALVNEIYQMEKEEGEALLYYYNSWFDEWVEFGLINEAKKLKITASDEDFEYIAKDIDNTYDDIIIDCEQREEWWG